MIHTNIDYYLNDKLFKLDEENQSRKKELYEDVPDDRLKTIFSKAHFEIERLLKYLNDRISNGHYTANESRQLLYWIDYIDELEGTLKSTELAFIIDDSYKAVLDKCLGFLSESGGSTIPEDFEKFKFKIAEPIFTMANLITVDAPDGKVTYPAKLKGEGSYAHVFEYKDTFYNKKFIIKRAKKDLNEKELKRFKREFETMNSLYSPYVIEVYKYDDTKNEYIMEYMDCTLYNYIMKNNSELKLEERRCIALQVLKAFEYLHSKDLLHRDISLTNILLKKYEDVLVVKISDFGLVKIPNSNLTSTYSELKGSLNDKKLELVGFDNYKIEHETFALTRVLYFIMTGKTNLEKLKETTWEAFVLKGLEDNLENRYKSIDEMKKAFNKMF